MNDHLFALLLFDQSVVLESLKLALKHLSVETCSARTLEEAERLLPQTQPHLIFTDTFLPDGSWVDVINLAEKAASPLNVIVVGTTTNSKLYLSALERGAFDFVLPPFEHQALDFVVKSAGQDVRHRRQAQAVAAGA
jgi:two-component system response regulator AtoC